MTTFKPALSQINVTLDDALDLLHESDRSPENPVVVEAREILARLPEICDLRGGYVFLDDVDVRPDDGIIVTAQGTLAPQKKICTYLKHAERLVLFVCTAGAGFTELTRRYNSEGDYLKGFVIDVFGTLTVERTADFLTGQLENEVAAQGLKITNRYSPGYCNWPLTGQAQVFAMLPPKPCGIELSESMLMQPIKSVSAIAAVGANVKKNKYACDVCSDIHCTYRNILIRRKS